MKNTNMGISAHENFAVVINKIKITGDCINSIHDMTKMTTDHAILE